MFKKQVTSSVPRCPVCGVLMVEKDVRTRIAVTYPPVKTRRVQDAKQDIRYASLEVCAGHLDVLGIAKASLNEYLMGIHAVLGVDAPGLQAELS